MNENTFNMLTVVRTFTKRAKKHAIRFAENLNLGFMANNKPLHAMIREECVLLRVFVVVAPSGEPKRLPLAAKLHNEVEYFARKPIAQMSIREFVETAKTLGIPYKFDETGELAELDGYKVF